MVVAALLEDYKSRWQELLNFEAEINRWFTLYVTAVIAVIGWFMGNASFTSVQPFLKNHDGLNSILVLILAMLNAVYILALAFNGYRIQQIGQYLYSHVGTRITAVSGEPFNVWEEWRRHYTSDPNAYGPEVIRKFYFASLSLIPVLVSVLLIGIYWYFEGRTQAILSGHNLLSYAVMVITIAIAFTAVSTAAQNVQWQRLIERRFREEAALGIKRSFDEQPPNSDSVPQSVAALPPSAQNVKP
jgi:hypothetical protein